MSMRRGRNPAPDNAALRTALSYSREQQNSNMSAWSTSTPDYQQGPQYYSSYPNSVQNPNPSNGYPSFGYPSSGYPYGNDPNQAYTSSNQAAWQSPYTQHAAYSNQYGNSYDSRTTAYAGPYGSSSGYDRYYDEQNRRYAEQMHSQAGYPIRYDDPYGHPRRNPSPRRFGRGPNQRNRSRSPPQRGRSSKSGGPSRVEIEKMLEDQIREIAPNGNITEDKLFVCHQCGQIGHVAKGCNRPRVEKETRRQISRVLGELKEKYVFGRNRTRSSEGFPRRDSRGGSDGHPEDPWRISSAPYGNEPFGHMTQPRFETIRMRAKSPLRRKRGRRPAEIKRQRTKRARSRSRSVDFSHEAGLKILLDKVCEGDQQIIEMKKLAEEKKLTEDMTTLCYKCAGMGHVKKDCTFEGEPKTREDLRKMRILKKSLHRINGTSITQPSFRLEAKDPFCSQLRLLSPDGIQITEDMLTICHKCAKLGHKKRDCKRLNRPVSSSKLQHMRRYLTEFQRLTDKGKTLRSIFVEAGIPYTNLVDYEKDVKYVVKSIVDQLAKEAGDDPINPIDPIEENQYELKENPTKRKRKAEQEDNSFSTSEKLLKKGVYEDFAKQLAELEESLNQEQAEINQETESPIQDNNDQEDNEKNTSQENLSTINQETNLKSNDGQEKIEDFVSGEKCP